MLPIDAAFMPIKRVSYVVEPARVGEVLDYDKLTIEIWSNGSVEVTQALAKAANLLIDHFKQIAAITGQPATSQIIAEEIEEKEPEEQTSNYTIEDLELSVRAYNCLKRASINSMAELLKNQNMIY